MRRHVSLINAKNRCVLRAKVNQQCCHVDIKIIIICNDLVLQLVDIVNIQQMAPPRGCRNVDGMARQVCRDAAGSGFLSGLRVLSRVSPMTPQPRIAPAIAISQASIYRIGA
jgi:hypothetical protein